MGSWKPKPKGERLLVVYRCNACSGGAILDAYQGPPSCTCRKDYDYMRAVRLAPEDMAHEEILGLQGTVERGTRT